jgi:hypothetical protein
MKSTDKFPIQKCAIFRKFKKIGGMARRHTSVCRTSDSVDLSRLGVIDAEIAEKGHLWTETNEHIAIDTIAEGNDPIDP